MDREMCETVRQLCMLAAHEQSDDNLTRLVEEIYRIVSAAQEALGAERQGGELESLDSPNSAREPLDTKPW